MPRANKDAVASGIELEAELRRVLDEHWSSRRLITLSDLPKFQALLQAVVLEQSLSHVISCLARLPGERQKKSKAVDDESGRIILRGVDYTASLAIDPRSHHTVVFVMRPVLSAVACRRYSQKGSFTTKLAHITDVDVDVWTAEDDSTAKRWLAAASDTVSRCLISGLAYVDEVVRSHLLASASDDLVSRVYSRLRQLVPSEKLGKRIFLYAINPESNSGIVMDSRARQAAYELLRDERMELPKSPADLLALLLTKTFPFQKTVAKDIFPSMRTLTVDARGIPSGSAVGTTQHVIFGKDGLVLQPIYKSDSLYLEIGYPQSLKGEIEHRINADRHTISRIAEEATQAVSLHVLEPVDSHEASVQRAETLGAFVGTALGALVKFLSHPE